MTYSRSLCFVGGMLSGLSFAPLFFIPLLFSLSLLCYQIRSSSSIKQASLLGFLFGFGYFLTGMYWVSIGVSVYIEEFWWAMPFALFGLPLVLGCFIAGATSISWLFKERSYYRLAFCFCWVFFEWLRSWLFTGLPWNLLGHSLSFAPVLIQVASIGGVYGISFITIYVFSVFYYIFTRQWLEFRAALLTSAIIICTVISYGTVRLAKYPSQFSNLQVRLVQPSIPQIAKWDADIFWQNLDAHLELSKRNGNPDLIIWSEAALVVPYTYPPIKDELLDMLKEVDAILATGGVIEDKNETDTKIYTSLYAVNQSGEKLFEYHKSHLVPFGEYVPLKSILPIKKLTYGFIDYAEGDGKLVKLSKFNLTIRALICYEAIFAELARTSNKKADLIINVTNDAWYGNSSGPHQHFYISLFRAIENGLPMLRVANNGISAVVDPLGRIVAELPLNKVGIIDSNCPMKISTTTIYSHWGDAAALIVALAVSLIQLLVKTTPKIFTFINKKA